MRLLDKYESFGPLPGMIITMLESFLPFLPLIAFVIANAAAYGLWKGFFFSWIGICIGSVIVFFISRRFGQKFTAYIFRRYPTARNFLQWIERKGFTTIFVVSCIPFSPSFLINVVAGLTRVPFTTFLIAILLGKAFMVFLVSYIGYDLPKLVYQPWKLGILVIIILIMWIIGRKLETKLTTNEKSF